MAHFRAVIPRIIEFVLLLSNATFLPRLFSNLFLGLCRMFLEARVDDGDSFISLVLARPEKSTIQFIP